MSLTVLLHSDGSVAAQVIDYIPEHDNPDGLLEAVAVAAFTDNPMTDQFDRKAGCWVPDPQKVAAFEQTVRAEGMSRGELVAWIDRLEARLAALENR